MHLENKKVNLLIASYIFFLYAAWNPLSFYYYGSQRSLIFVSRALYGNKNDPVKKKLLLVVSLIGNLGMFCFLNTVDFVG